MEFDPERVWANVRQATTEDLLDRVTVYRDGMEPEAVDIIEAELHRRGVRADQVEAHAREREEGALWLPDGTAQPCSFCRRPAIGQGWGWRRGSPGGRSAGWFRLLAGPLAWLSLVVPVFPRPYYFCEEHRPGPKPDDAGEEASGE